MHESTDIFYQFVYKEMSYNLFENLETFGKRIMTKNVKVCYFDTFTLFINELY